MFDAWKKDGGIQIGRKVIKEVRYLFFSVCCGVSLFRCERAERHKGGVINCSGIVEDATNDLLDARDPIGVQLGTVVLLYCFLRC